ncbi:MAG: SAM-dependent methyltransferase [Planctomycetota bacterium]
MIPPPARPETDPRAIGVPRIVSRGFHKLQHALHEFEIDPAGMTCVDLGASVGGFTQCLLAFGAAHVTALDTARGVLDYLVRRDEHVTVLERTNALHAEATTAAGLVVVDLGWTPQRLALPAARRWLAPGGRIVSLIKPHYEAKAEHVLGDDDAHQITQRTLDEVGGLGFEMLGLARSPIAGSRRRGSSAGKGGGNAEWLALFGDDPRAQPGAADAQPDS